MLCARSPPRSRRLARYDVGAAAICGPARAQGRHRVLPRLLRPVVERRHARLFVVAGLAGGARYGRVAADNALPDLGHAYIAYLRSSERRAEHEVSEGMVLFLDHLFDTMTFRKLYAEVPGYNEDLLNLGAVGLFREEGRSIEHDFHQGRWWDRIIYALWRDDWKEFSNALRGTTS